MSIPLESIENRIDYALQLLADGVKKDDSEIIETALMALPELMREAIEIRKFHLIETIISGQKALFSEHGALVLHANRKLSADNLEQILQHTAPTPTHYIWNAGITKMSGRTTLMLARNHIQFKPDDVADSFQLLVQFAEKKHKDAFSLIFGHIAKRTLAYDDFEFQKYFSSGQDILSCIDRYARGDESIKVVLNGFLDNQEEVLGHVARQKQTIGEHVSTIPFEYVQRLHKMGFDRLAKASMPGLLSGFVDIRQYIIGEMMGLDIDLDLIRSQMTGDNGGTIEAHALAYVIESKRYSLDDFKRLVSEVVIADKKPTMSLLKSLPSAAAPVLKLIFSKARIANHALIMAKTELLLDWVLAQKPSPDLEAFKTEIVNIPSLPRALVETRSSLRDSKFSRDIGL